jgi:hypothetical protein
MQGDRNALPHQIHLAKNGITRINLGWESADQSVNSAEICSTCEREIKNVESYSKTLHGKDKNLRRLLN